MFVIMSPTNNTYSGLNKTKLKYWFCLLLVALMFAEIFSPAILLVAFQMHFGEHFVECQHNRSHNQATCILTEIMPEQIKTVADRVPLYFFLNLFFLDCFLCSSSSLFKGILVIDQFFHYLKHYSPPVLRIHKPPPKFQ